MNASMAPPSTWANSAALTSYTYTAMIGSPFVARPRLRRLGRCRMVLTDLGAARYGPFTFPYGEPGGCDRFMQVFPGRDRTGNNRSLAPSPVEVPQSVSPGGAGNGHPRVSRPHISDRSESAPERFFPRSQAASRRARRPKAKASDPFGNRFSAQESFPRCPPGLRHPGCRGRRDREGLSGLGRPTTPPPLLFP